MRKIHKFIDDLGLSHSGLCHSFTRPESGKILDFVITNNPNMVSNVISVPGISDHNIVISNWCVIIKN